MKLRKEEMKEIAKVLLFFVVVMGSLLILCSFFNFPKVSGPSMLPSFRDGDMMLTRYTENIKVGDVVVIRNDELDEYLVKRVIGVSGDHIEMKDGYMYRNGERLYEAYVSSQTWCMDTYDVTVPEGQLFILGDNRLVSFDSRALGCMPISDIYGKVLCNLSTWQWFNN